MRKTTRPAAAAAVLLAILTFAATGCASPMCPDDFTLGTAVKDYRTNPKSTNRDWSFDYVSVQFRWRLKPERVRND